MEDIFLICCIIIFAGIVIYLIISSIVSKIKEPHETELRAIAAKKDLIATQEEAKKRRYDLLYEEYYIKSKKLDNKIAELAQKESEIEKLKHYHEGTIQSLDTYIYQKCDSYPRLAGMIADFLTLHYEKSANFLENKKRPAYMEAWRIRDLRRETRGIIKEKKELEYKLAYIEKLFPNVTDIFDPGFNEEADFELETEENTDRVRLLLTDEEYAALSTVEKNQLALDRYVENRKSKWQIGRDYEMYVGYTMEKLGYKVRYNGIIESFEDMGRDLIATNSDSTYIIQCKNWSQEKTIHEKHIFQLYGTTILFKIEHPHSNVRAVFVTSTKLSSTAKAVAKELNIEVKEEYPLGDFPRIKCNINRTTGERIYHLPFDQQYDKTVVESNRGECYAMTVREAEDKGYRRAWRHFVE